MNKEMVTKILNYIPGFRSNTNWKKVIACIYYFFCLMMLINVGLPYFNFLISGPFAVFGLIDLIKKRTITTLTAILPFILPLSVMIINASSILS